MSNYNSLVFNYRISCLSISFLRDIRVNDITTNIYSGDTHYHQISVHCAIMLKGHLLGSDQNNQSNKNVKKLISKFLT